MALVWLFTDKLPDAFRRLKYLERMRWEDKVDLQKQIWQLRTDLQTLNGRIDLKVGV